MERQKKKEVLKQKRETPHIARRVYHLLMGLFCFSLYAWFISREQAIQLLAGLGIPFVLLDLIRLKVPALNAAALKLFGTIMRREELLRFSANSYYIFALAILVVIFPKPIALLGILYLAVGDPVAAIVGSNFGRHPLIGGKSWEGTLANFAVCVAGTFLFAQLFLVLSLPTSLAFALVGGAISAVAEVIPLPVNDNLYFPVLSAVLLTGANYLFHFF